ncbi:hypothetical protein [Listeria booriae]|uniref:Uncharacterized protein n=1 Tax=Listeria booriae TaxID=1552123 RepID=A0A7X0XZD1_9LIST|nr:hypothetical protein [Listeria booriae]MBC1794476.1 hypothetical protein [Listeria booriae]MBC1801809.1 hypothetical protein [Listeria booriae]MBC1804056.1 hypothetical protein [Listeria booriae]MBC2037203.1 hypothetical protein [Listeria booriae]
MENLTMKEQQQEIIKEIKKYWNGNISDFKVVFEDFSYGSFELEFSLYSKFDILLTYERGGAGFKIRKKNTTNEFVIMTKYTDETVYRGLDSLRGNNFLENIRTLDTALKNKILEEKKKSRGLER